MGATNTEEIQVIDIQRLPRAWVPQKNHHWDYRNPPREEQGRVPGEPPSSHIAEAPGSCSDEPIRILQGPRATLPQPLATGATKQTPQSTVPTTEPPTPHQDRTNSPGKRSPASGKHPGPASPTTAPATTQTHHITTTATIAQGETLSSSALPSPSPSGQRQQPQPKNKAPTR
ncbi:hypothetical protein CRENBAI_026014 [Crenichthys baileyi]|uniref:Uncharacterized protein n=1 Tax=Crenichthys baileyi TaxID=28760 RepID=A0AAV9RZC5_9TELE